MAGMNASQILSKCQEMITKQMNIVKHYKATVKVVNDSGIFVQYAWSNTTSTIPIPKLKHVAVTVNDLVLMDRLDGSYIIVGVIE